MSNVGGVQAPSSDGGGAPSSMGADTSDFDFGTIDPMGDLDGVVIEAEAPAAPAPEAPAAPEAPQPVAPPAPAPAAQPQAQPQPAAVQPTAQPQPQAPAVDPAVLNTPEGFLQSFEQGRDNLINIFAEQTFALSDEDKMALEADPSTMVPKLLGRGLFYAVSAAQRLLMTQLPTMLESHMERTTTARSAETKFYEAFGDLKDSKYTADIQKFADFYKQFPDMPLEDRIQAIGTAVRLHYKLPTPTAPAAAAAPWNKSQPQVVQQQVFQPAAAAGGAARGSAIVEETDPFAGALRDYGD